MQADAPHQVQAADGRIVELFGRQRRKIEVGRRSGAPDDFEHDPLDFVAASFSTGHGQHALSFHGDRLNAHSHLVADLRYRTGVRDLGAQQLSDSGRRRGIDQSGRRQLVQLIPAVLLPFDHPHLAGLSQRDGENFSDRAAWNR